MTSQETFVVIGAGQAGGRAVEAMRAEGFDGRIVLVGAEAHVPYERPPLSKQLLISDDEEPARTYIHGADFYREKDIDLRLGVQATHIDRDARRVTLSDGDTLDYSKLLLTTGSKLRRLSIPGSGLASIHYLRNIEESLAIRSKLTADAALVVVGGGYIGLEVAAAARTRGCRVTVIEMEEVVMNRVVAPEIGRFFAEVHRAQGVDIRTGEGVAGFDGEDRVTAVVGASGTRYPADLVVVGVGILAETSLAEAAGLEVTNGVDVDEFGQTSDPDIFAAGDVANQPSPIGVRRWRLESWRNAQNQAIAVARVMCGTRTPYAETPWFWSDQYDLNLQMTGLTDSWDRLVFRGDPADRKFTAFYMAADRVVMANAVNAPRELRFARMLIEAAAPVADAALADPAVPLKSLLPAG